MPCPKCGENLLTQDDYDLNRKLKNYIKFVNRWFSWITIFFPKSSQYEKITRVHVHNWINITEEK